jgi:antitoxin component YwqK of YwqJK toxin-antitoxin module
MRRLFAACFLVAICSLVAQQAVAQPVAEQRTLHASGHVKQPIERFKVGGEFGFRQTDFYEDGSIYRKMTWVRGFLEGPARVYSNRGLLKKTVIFKRGRIPTFY